MNTEQMINSIYNPRKKMREAFVFPKISKVTQAPPENKVFVRGASRKYNQQNIFKIEDEKKQRVKLHIQEERIKDLRQREYDQLQLKMGAMARRHQDQMRQLQQQQKKLSAQIQAAKKTQYDVKYSLWQLKNEIMNLNVSYLDHQSQYQRLYQEVGYIENGEEGQYEGEEGEEGEEGQGELEEHGENNEGEEGQRESQAVIEEEEGRGVSVQMSEAEKVNELRSQRESHSVL